MFSNYCKKINKIVTHLIFFPVKAEGPYFSKKKAPFVHKIDARALFEKKAPLFFEKSKFNKKSKKGV